jgi:MoaA/NifB/PqqE/SkfB family radical SAM enzyme
MEIIGALVIGLFTSLMGNLVFSVRAIIHWLRRRRREKTLLRFWRTPIGDANKAYIFYPCYPNPRVGRTQKELGYYIADEDTKAVELLEHSLTSIGFKCQRRISPLVLDSSHSFPKDGIVLLVCGPKVDVTTNRVSYDPWTGGNSASSWFYLRYHDSMGITLAYNHDKQRKEYRFLGDRELASPQDETPPRNADKGLLARCVIDGQMLFLFWGIHGPATFAAVKASLDPVSLDQLPLQHHNLLATVEAEIDNETGEIRATASWTKFEFKKDLVSGTKPHPFVAGAYLSREKPVYGLSYLWATRKNIERIKKGDYAHLSPVAVELDASLDCPYACQWCPYRQLRTGAVLRDKSIATALVDRFAEEGVRLVVLTGGGEPLVSTCIEAIVDRCRERKMLVTLYTNGVLLDDVRAYYLMSRKIREIRFSLDDVSTETAYRAIHGLKGASTGELASVRRNIESTLALRTRNGFDTRVGASFLVSDKTIPNLIASARTLRDWLEGVGPFDYIVLRPAVQYWPGADAHDAYLATNEFTFAQLRSVADEFARSAVARHTIISWERFRDLAKEGSPTYRKCLASTVWLNIGPDGTAFLCCETKHMQNCQLGNLLNDSLETLQQNALVTTKREPFGASGCPRLLCKPSALNRLFADIESKRNPDGSLPYGILTWLDEMAAYSEESGTADIFIPSVSGVYEAYSSST